MPVCGNSQSQTEIFCCLVKYIFELCPGGFDNGIKSRLLKKSISQVLKNIMPGLINDHYRAYRITLHTRPTHLGRTLI